MTDQAVIEAVLRGETDAFAELVDRYQSMALQTAYGILGNEQDARDAAQEAFISAYRSLKRFRGQSKFSTWLYRIVVNKCKDAGRKRGRSPVGWLRVGESGNEAEEGIFIEIGDTSAAPDHSASRNEIVIAFEAAFARLPEKQRTAFSLFHLQGLDQKEIASIMQCGLGTVKTHVFRATHTLKQALTPWLEEVQDEF